MKRFLVLLVLIGLVIGGGAAYGFTQGLGRFESLSDLNSSTVLGESDAADGGSSTTTVSEPQLGRPVRLVVPSLNIDTEIEHVGLDDQKRMDVPQADENVAWYEYGAVPGELGSAVLAGHYDTQAATPAVFYDLSQLQPGAEIHVYDAEGRSLTFIVTDTQLYKDAHFPISHVFGQNDSRRLNLITCSGRFSDTERNYEDRLVVYSVLQE